MLPLIGEEGKVRIGEAVNVVQHPGGRVKQVVIRNNWLVDLPEGADMERFFHYVADTEKGSSGSPVFNDQWEVVALHHSGVPKTNERDELIDADGNVLHDEDSPRIVWVANEGIRVSRIVDAVRTAQLSPEMARIRDEALVAWQVRGQPSVAERIADQPDGILREEAGLSSGSSTDSGTVQVDVPVVRTPERRPGDRGTAVGVTIPIRIVVSFDEPVLGSGTYSATADGVRYHPRR